MPYTPREAMIVALYNANIEPLHEAADIAEKVLSNLKNMGFAVVDVHHASDLSAAQRAYDRGHPSALPPRLAHLKVVTDNAPPQR